MKKIVALFDCDGTLYSARYGYGLIKYSFENGHKHAVCMYYVANLPLSLLHKIKVISGEAYHRPLISRLTWIVKGMTEDDLRQASKWINKNYLLPTEQTEIINRMREHQTQGHLVVLVSAQLLPSLETLGEYFNADGLVGTKPEMKNGRYTGRIIPPTIIGKDKNRYARKYFSSHAIDVDWEASYAYADSITDSGLLGMVGHPVAVNPDLKLLALAQKNNWEIISTFRKGS